MKTQPRIYNFSKLDNSKLERLVILHESVMPTLLTDLGKVFIRWYYEAIVEDSAAIGLFASPNERNLIGWVVGSPHPSSINAQLRKPICRFAVQILKLMFKRPRVLVHLLQSVVSSAQNDDLTRGTIELTYIGVSAAGRGRGVGTILLDAFVGAAAAAGYSKVLLSVETDNVDAVNMYSKYGFRVACTFNEGRFERNRMVLDI